MKFLGDLIKSFLRRHLVSRKEIGDRENQIYQIISNNLQQMNEMGMELLTSIMQIRLLFTKMNFTSNVNQIPVKRQSSHIESFEVYLQSLKELHPHFFDTWVSINLVNQVDRYKEHPEKSCAIEARKNARLFRGFIAPYLRGRILDVGCGPYTMPYYLEGYPVELISGIDPLEPYEPHPFEFVRGFAEFLPWEDSIFDVLIAATSLDHTLSLELALSEIRRVLKLGGYLLVWDWFANESEPYQPDEQSPHLVDDHHLFHFNEDWFEEIMLKNYSIEEKIRLYGRWMYDRYYALKLSRK